MARLAEFAIETPEAAMKVANALNTTESKGEACEKLGISRPTLRKWMELFDIEIQYVVRKTKNAQDQKQ